MPLVKIKGTLHAILVLDPKPSDQVLIYYPLTGIARVDTLITQTDADEWMTKSGETVEKYHLHRLIVAYEANQGKQFLAVKYSQWQAFVEGKVQIRQEVEFEIVQGSNKEYAKIIPNTPHYTTDHILKAYRLGREDGSNHIISSEKVILDKLK